MPGNGTTVCFRVPIKRLGARVAFDSPKRNREWGGGGREGGGIHGPTGWQNIVVAAHSSIETLKGAKF